MENFLISYFPSFLEVLHSTIYTRDMKSADNLKYLFNPSSIAIVGASRNAEKVGNKVLRNLLLGGFKGEVYPINPNAEEIYNLKCYKSLSLIPKDIDLVWIRVCTRDLLETCKDAVSRNAKVVIVNSKELETEEGKIIISEVKKLLDSKGILMLGLGSAGIYFENLDLLSVQSKPIKGGLSLLTQSDNLIESLVDLWNDDNVGVESIIGLGSKLGLNENDIIEFYLSNSQYLPKVICMYLENLSNPGVTLENIKKISKEIPVIAMFPIANPITRKKVVKHTGSVLQDYEYLELALSKSGVNLVNSITELTSLTMLYKNIGKDFYASWLPFVLTNSFFLTLEAHSMLYKNDIPTLEPSGVLKEKLIEFYAKEIKTEVDYLAMIDRLFKEDDLDTVFLSLTKDESIDLYLLSEGIERLERDYNKLVIVTVLEVNYKVNPHRIFNSKNIANYKYLENAIYAYIEIRKRADYLSNETVSGERMRTGLPYVKVDFEKKSEILSIVKELKSQSSKCLNFVTAKKLLQNYGVTFVDDFSPEVSLKEKPEYILNLKCVKDTYPNDKENSSIGYKLDLNLIYHEGKNFVNLSFTDLLPLDTEQLEIEIFEKFGKIFVDDKRLSVLISEVKRIAMIANLVMADYPGYFEKLNLTFTSTSKLVFILEETEIDIVI
ncbi:MAG: CoA-binding protein [bacterium]